jgi:hypothetical protein
MAVFSQTRALEELYDLAADPWEVRHLAADPAHTLQDLRTRLERGMVETNDQGRRPEPESRYDSDRGGYRGRKPNADVERKIALMKRWAEESK